MTENDFEPRGKFDYGRYFRMIAVFIALLAIALGAYYWAMSKTSNNNVLQNKVDKTEQALDDYETAMRNDTYGGKTPQETLNLFIAALEKGDIELASKYFELEGDTQNPDYLTRKKWESQLEQALTQNRISQVLEILIAAKPDLENISDKNDYKFASNDRKGNLQGYIDMQLNSYSGVWKIESL